jgi:hypothetical protein
VLPGRIYRSAQLSPSELASAIDRHGLRTVINLRGAKNGRDWYDRQIDLLTRRDLVQYDIDLSSRLLPPRPSVLRLIELLETAPEPLLLHCGAGADRTGFASAVARIVRADDRVGAARAQLGVGFGHLPFGPSAEIARFFDLYSEHLTLRGEPDSSEAFKRWVRLRYVPYAYLAQIEAVRAPERIEPAAEMDVVVRIRNTSPGPWQMSTSRSQGIKLGIRIRREGEQGWREFDRTGYVARAVQPGETLEMAAPMRAPSEPGRYWLKLDMVDEHVTWFEDQGSTPLVLRVDVLHGRVGGGGALPRPPPIARALTGRAGRGSPSATPTP